MVALKSVVRLAGLAVLGAMSLSAAAMAQDYYKGKTLTIVVASNPGGGTDTTARLLTRYWGNHIPGNPEIVVRNKPLGVIAANDLQHSTRPDGLTVGAFAGGGTLGPVSRKTAAVKYDPLSWGFIGSIERGSTILMVRKSAYDRMMNSKAKPVAAGSVSTDRPQDAMALFGAEYLGWNVKFVLGYPSSNELYMAFERGEIDMFGSGTNSILKRFIDTGEAVALSAEAPRADYPNVPTFDQVLGDKKPTGDQWQAFRAWSGPSAVDKFFVVPPGTPVSQLEILRASFKSATEDKDFQAQADTMLGDGFNMMSGPQVQETIRDVLVLSPNVVSVANGLRKKYGLPLASELK